MKKLFTLPAAAFSLALAAATAMPLAIMVSGSAFAADKPPPKPGLSQPVFKPMKEASDLLDKKDYQGALAKAQEADQVPNKTPYDTYVVQDFLGRTYLVMKDYAHAAAAFEASYASGAMPAEAKPSRLKITTELFLQNENYPKAIEFDNHYLTDVGPDAEMEGLLGQADYQTKDLKAASEAMRKAIALADAAKIPAKEEWFHYLEHAEADQQNLNGVIDAEEMLVVHFPTTRSWTSLLTNVEDNIKGSDKVTLDIFRLQLAAGVMKNAADFMEMAKLALKQELPGDAQTALQKGYDTGVLATGPLKGDADQLKTRIAAAVDSDMKSIDSGAKLAAAQKTGDADIKFGEAYRSYGRYDDAIAAIQRGIGKGVKDMDDANLRLGLAYLGAGKKTEALAALNGITSNTPTAQVAHLWVLYVNNPPTATAAAPPAAQ